MTEEIKPVTTKDRRTILVLTYLNHVPLQIEPIASGDHRIMLYHFDTEAHTHFEAWMRGSREEPFDMLRKFFECEDMFKNNLHRFANNP